MSGLKSLAGHIERERPGARQLLGMRLPGGAVVPFAAVEAGRMAAFITWDEDRPFRRAAATMKQALEHFHEVWLVTTVEAARQIRKALPIEVGIRIVDEDGGPLGVGHPASIMRPAVKELVELLSDNERAILAALLGVRDTTVTLAAAGSLRWGTLAFVDRLCDTLGDRAGPAPDLLNPSPEMILKAARPSYTMPPLVVL